LYDLLRQVDSSPAVELNWAVAVAMRDGDAKGPRLMDELLAKGNLANRFAHWGRAELCWRLARKAEARASYERALELTEQQADQVANRNLLGVSVPGESRPVAKIHRAKVNGARR